MFRFSVLRWRSLLMTGTRNLSIHTASTASWNASLNHNRLTKFFQSSGQIQSVQNVAICDPDFGESDEVERILFE